MANRLSNRGATPCFQTRLVDRAGVASARLFNAFARLTGDGQRRLSAPLRLPLANLLGAA